MDKVNLGDVVALKSHPYSQFLNDVIICGEPQFISPLMVIVEFYGEVKDQYDERTGNPVTQKGIFQCKCIWYSTKNHQFEEAWISSKLLKHIHFEVDTTKYHITDDGKNELLGSIVGFKTNSIEFGKRKNSISVEANSINNNKDKNITTPLLSFSSPIMHVIQVSEAKLIDPKEISYDQKTGEKKRFASKWLVKCKWYNPNDKLSEKFLPIECLELIPTVSTELLSEIKGKIAEFGFYKLGQKKSDKQEYTLIDPKEIQFANGYYSLKAFDLLENKINIIRLDQKLDFIDVTNYFSVDAPNFDLSDGEVLPENYFINQYIDLIKLSKTENKYLRIIYKNRSEIIKTRTLKNYSIINITEGAKTIQYLTGFCLSRKSIRTFRIDGIQKMQQLNLIID